MTFQSINQIQTKVVRRITTGYSEVDWLYGVSVASDNIPVWGLPEASISLWAGASGIGKSRLAIELARSLSRGKGRHGSYTILYFQNETTKQTFANWVRADGGLMPSNFYVSESSRLFNQLKDIRDSRAVVIFVDSLNMLEDFGYGSDQSIKKIINGYREVCQERKCHIILLSQLTKQGEARGSATLSHLVDIVFHLNKQGPDWFAFTVGNKHRYGRTGDNFFSFWGHTDKGIICLSDYRTEDKLWCQTHGIPLNDRFVRAKAEWDAEQARLDKEEDEEIRRLERDIRRQNLLYGLSSGVGNLLTGIGAAFAGLMTYEAFKKKD